MSILERNKRLTRDNMLELHKAMYSEQSANSHKSFDNGLKRIEKVYGSPLEKVELKFIVDPNDLITKMIDKSYSENTICATLSTICKVCHICDLPSKYYKIVKNFMISYKQHIQEERHKNEKTQREKEQWIPWQQIYDKVFLRVDSYLSDKKMRRTDYMYFLQLALFVLQTPRRIGNYLNLDVFITPVDVEKLQLIGNRNFLCINNGEYTFVFNRYKTAKYCGSQVYKVTNPDLIKLLDRWFKDYNPNPKHLFIDRHRNELKDAAFIFGLKQVTKKLFNKEFSVDILRHSFISDLAESNPTVSEKINIAAELGQTYRPQMLDMYNRK